LGRGATVLLITDGLDREEPELLAAEARRLRLSCRRLIWLNPLLRWDGFEPRARGVRALLREVDAFRATHDIASLRHLAAALNDDSNDGLRGRYSAMLNDPTPPPKRLTFEGFEG
jgi:uncharacterized protein with von Willebrand factor type A (vWA) domain